MIDTQIKDSYRAEQARFFHTLVLSFGVILAVACTVLVIINYMGHPALNWVSLFNGIVVMSGVILSYFLSKKGYYYAGIYLFLIIITVCTSYAMTNRGLSFTIILVYAVSVITAGLLIGPKSSFIFAIFSMANYGIAFYWLVINDRIRHPDIFSMAVFNMLAFICSMIVITLLTSLISKGLKKRVDELKRINKQRVKAMNETKRALHEKEILLREIHHRVKNNLQIISSLLSLQSGQHDSRATHEVLRDTQNRIKSMALIHEKLYMTSDISRLDFGEYLKVLVNHMSMSYLINPESVEIEMDVDDIELDVDTAMSCGLVVNELVSNSMKYAFKGRDSGVISITTKLDDDNKSFTLTISDNGIGIPKSIDIRNLDSLGLQLVDTLVCEMDGNVKVISREGTKFIIIIPYSGSRGDKDNEQL